MRSPRKDILPTSDRLRVPVLDMTHPESIALVLDAAGRIDILVNNPGIGLFAPSRPRRMRAERMDLDAWSTR